MRMLSSFTFCVRVTSVQEVLPGLAEQSRTENADLGNERSKNSLLHAQVVSRSLMAFASSVETSATVTFISVLLGLKED